MSTPTRRRPSSAVFRRRRFVLVLIVIAVIAAVALAIWQPWHAGGTPSTSQTPASSTSAPTSAPAEPVEAETPTEAAADPVPDPGASDTEPAIAACTTSDITVQAITDKDAYGAGELPQLSIALSNTSATPCLINVGTTTQSFVITSGSDTWWRSTDCQSESSDQVVQLAAGQTVSSVTPITWDRTRSSVGTCESTRPGAPAGYFHLQVSIGGIQAADTRMFQLR